jgi:hypothetical protein
MSRRLSFSPSLHPSLIALALLLVYAFLQLSSLAVTSITLDEPSHLVAGYAFLTRGDTRIKLNGPLLPNLIGALPLLLQPDLKLTPPDDPMWDANDHNGLSDEFVWRNTVSPFRLIFLARFPYLAIGWLLGALIFRWATERGGAWAGVFALTLFVFDPNLLAHSRFVMTDFAPAAAACFALYALDRALRQPPSRKWLILAGGGLGLALASKFSLIMLVVAACLLFAFNHLAPKDPMVSSRRGGPHGVAVRFFCLMAVAAFTVWGVYAFQIGPVDPGGLPVPAPGFWREWQSAQYYLTQPWPNYLFGQTSATGWWYYFPIALLVKTPLPILILFVVALARTLRRNLSVGVIPSSAPCHSERRMCHSERREESLSGAPCHSEQRMCHSERREESLARPTMQPAVREIPRRGSMRLLRNLPVSVIPNGVRNFWPGQPRRQSGLEIPRRGSMLLGMTREGDAIFLVPLALIFISLLFSTNNLGYRYLLPLLPVSFVYIARSLSPSLRPPVILSLLLWLILGTLAISPYYLTYFNEIAGGPERGRFILSDSNLDWGQDLVGLKNYLDRNNLPSIKLSYFGIAHPTAYGLTTEALPPVRTAMNDQGAWWLKKFNPLDPAPGVYAISVANLMGGIWIERDAYAFFRDRPPDTTIGNSIYLYTIAPRGPAADLSLAGLQIDQIDADTYRRFNTNDVRPRWFEAASALIAAPGESWLALADDQPVAPEVKSLFAGVQPITQAKLTDEDRTYALYHFNLAQRLLDAAPASSTGAASFGDTATLIGYRLDRVGRDLTLIATWCAGEAIVTPLQMFVHVLDANGAIVAQADQLDASPFGWRAGDVIAQVHRLKIPADVPEYQVAIGFYNPATNERLPVTIAGRAQGDRFTLNEAQP